MKYIKYENRKRKIINNDVKISLTHIFDNESNIICLINDQDLSN
jgi:hypothetical protein